MGGRPSDQVVLAMRTEGRACRGTIHQNLGITLGVGSSPFQTSRVALVREAGSRLVIVRHRGRS